MTPKLAQLEMECMKVLWRLPGATVAQVRAGLPRPLAYTTVMTVLDRMSTKGVVARRKHGRAFVYSATLPREAARARAVQQLVSDLFDNDPRALAQYLAGAPAPKAPSRRISPRIDDTLL
jgi:predicted transcriptional regulator